MLAGAVVALGSPFDEVAAASEVSFVGAICTGAVIVESVTDTGFGTKAPETSVLVANLGSALALSMIPTVGPGSPHAARDVMRRRAGINMPDKRAGVARRSTGSRTSFKRADGTTTSM